MFEEEIVLKVCPGSSGVLEYISIMHRKRNVKIVEVAEVKSSYPVTQARNVPGKWQRTTEGRGDKISPGGMVLAFHTTRVATVHKEYSALIIWMFCILLTGRNLFEKPLFLI